MNSMRDAAVLLVLLVLALSVRVSDRTEEPQAPTPDVPETIEAALDVDVATESAIVLPAHGAELVRVENDGRVFVLQSENGPCGENRILLKLDTDTGSEVLVLEVGTSQRKQRRKLVALPPIDKA